ncbi:hypothetical protein ACFCX4_26390 [Kitasatospora sp. NPDC056327]|uniref:hypothetical protein n=1 Tax=Kitasatospora sp. NPDC056327 TaxID=3345785 RepID=UPI0035DAB025
MFGQGKIVRVVVTEAAEALGASKEDASALGIAAGVGVAVATADLTHIADVAGTVAEFAAQGDWTP